MEAVHQCLVKKVFDETRLAVSLRFKSQNIKYVIQLLILLED
jgi:hypothetical protein